MEYVFIKIYVYSLVFGKLTSKNGIQLLKTWAGYGHENIINTGNQNFSIWLINLPGWCQHR